MQIKDIIKTKRRECGYTQEQVAASLGVSTPAVNKWENGASFPDIALLAVVEKDEQFAFLREKYGDVVALLKNL